jgi:asparagine synthase (glutamine-hydrolysing)
MCGLAGIVDFERPVDATELGVLAGALAHRGPDDRDEWCGDGVGLAHRRLAIIDLSASGRQPMVDATGRLRLVFNGELYNYRELRPELERLGHRFATQTDTEVLLTAYAAWGPRCVERFRGMWSFAIWDDERRLLFCSRDRFGIKPLLYRLDGRRLVFASEIKAFRTAYGPLEANERVVHDYIAYSHLDRGEDTFVSGIKHLPPAHSLTFDRTGLRLSRYWTLQDSERPDDPVEAVRAAMFESLRLHVRSDVPVGTCLSGGIDSSTIVVGVRRLLDEGLDEHGAVTRKSFTAYFEEKGFDEREFARAAAEGAAVDDAHWITFDSDRLVRDLPTIIWDQDEPFGSLSQTAHWYVTAAAREAGITVLLDGQGGDEVFAGYWVSFGPRLLDLLGVRSARRLVAETRALQRVHGLGPNVAVSGMVRTAVPDWVTDWVRARRSGAIELVHPGIRRGRTRNGSAPKSFPDALRRHLADLLTRSQLPVLLRYEDRISMAHSIEARVPFLDHPLVELVFSLRGDDLIHDGRTKSVLRDAFADLLPPLIRDRTDKKGFGVPQELMLRGELGRLATEVFASSEFERRGFVNAREARKKLRDHLEHGAPAGWELWRVLNLELWARRYLE